MKSIKKAITGAIVLAVAGGGLLLGATSASAATPGFEPDANSQGGVSFYDASGNVVTSGNNLSHLFDFAAASSAGRTGTNKATLSFSFPDHTKPDSSTWFSSSASASTNFPVAAPANLAANPNPVVTLGSTDGNLTAALGGAVLDTTPGYVNLVQLRVKDSGVGKPALAKPFWETDILFNTTNNTWRQVFPAVAMVTTTALTATPNPQSAGSAVVLSSTTLTGDNAPGVGTVQFVDGSTNIGTPQTVNGTGVATLSTSALTAGAHSLSAVFTPTDPTAFVTSTGTASETITAPVPGTTTALALSGGYLTAGADATLTATVTNTTGGAANGAGTVAFFDNGSTTPIAGTASSTGTGNFTLDVPTGFTAGGHSVVAKFTPTDPTAFAASQSTAQAFFTQPVVTGACAQTGSVCTDTQNVTATIPVGTLVINTPYTAAAPLDLGAMALSTDSTTLTGSATFNNIVVTDTRSGNLPWTVSALASALTDGSGHANGTINAQNLGLTGVAQTSIGAGFTGTVTYTSNPAANGVAPLAPGALGLGGTTAHTVAAADHGLGTINMHGTLTLIAPTSTEPGVFAGTITFTVG